LPAQSKVATWPPGRKLIGRVNNQQQKKRAHSAEDCYRIANGDVFVKKEVNEGRLEKQILKDK